jgi:hypothetical protein
VTPYTPHARIVVEERVEGRSREPAPEELELLEDYRQSYNAAFGNYPAGTHFVDTLQKFAIFRRSGLPQDQPEERRMAGVPPQRLL